MIKTRGRVVLGETNYSSVDRNRVPKISALFRRFVWKIIRDEANNCPVLKTFFV